MTHIPDDFSYITFPFGMGTSSHGSGCLMTCMTEQHFEPTALEQTNSEAVAPTHGST